MAKLKISRLITVRVAIATLSIAALATPVTRAQAPEPRPDFSGTWAYDAAATDAVASPDRTSTAIFGSAFVTRQDAKTLTLDITVAPNTPVVQASYSLDGTPTKNVSPPVIRRRKSRPPPGVSGSMSLSWKLRWTSIAVAWCWIFPR